MCPFVRPCQGPFGVQKCRFPFQTFRRTPAQKGLSGTGERIEIHKEVAPTMADEVALFARLSSPHAICSHTPSLIAGSTVLDRIEAYNGPDRDET
jgi:hypothetical protein